MTTSLPIPSGHSPDTEAPPDVLAESFDAGTKFWIQWEFQELQADATMGALKVDVMTLDTQVHINATTLDGPKIKGVAWYLAEHYYSTVLVGAIASAHGLIMHTVEALDCRSSIQLSLFDQDVSHFRAKMLEDEGRQAELGVLWIDGALAPFVR